MTKLDRVSAAVIATALLVSCGGDDGGSGPGPVATSSPTPTPTPTPTQTFSYTAFDDLTGDQAFATACETYTYLGNGVAASDGSQWYALQGNIGYTEADETWTISQINGGGVVSFGPSERVTTTDGTVRYEIPGSPPQSLRIFAPEVNGVTPVYGRIAGYGVDFNSFFQTALCTLGVPTDPEDLPDATVVTYDQINLNGFQVEPPPGGPGSGPPLISRIVSGSGTITGNTDTGEITFSLSYVVADASGNETTVGPVEGTVGIDLSASDRAGYIGPLGAPIYPRYQVNGAFYGPQGRETGFIFMGDFDQDSNGLNEKFVLMNGYAIR